MHSQQLTVFLRSVTLCLGISVWLTAPSCAQVNSPQIPRLSGLPGISNSAAPTSMAVSGRLVSDAATRQAYLEITAEVPKGWHLYSLTQPPGGPMKARIKLDKSRFELAGEFQPDKPPQRVESEAFEGVIEEYHEDQVTWRAPITVDGDIQNLKIQGKLEGQICSESACLPLNSMDTKFTATYAGAIEIQGSAASKSVPRGSAAIIWPELLRHVGLGMLGGLILNLMPCVLPVIGLKVLSFIEQSQGSRWEAFRLNVIYSLGILSVFLILATLAATVNLGWGEQFTNVAFKLTLIVIVMAMALSFLGVWEIPIPGFVGRGSSQQLASREDAAGAFFKGVFTTILATPCSGPFLGPVFGYTIQQPPVVTYVIMLSVGVGMSLPYITIGAFPGLIRLLPRPGAWMETFKQLMGFVLLGTVVFLMTSLNQSLLLPTLALLFAVWFGCWWVGRISISASAGRKMMGWVGGIASTAALGFLSFQVLGPHQNYVNWQDYSPVALTSASEQGKTVMVDFTANWCLTCKTNLKRAIDTPRVSALLEENGVVPMLADWTDQSEEIKQTLESLGSKSIPLLAIFPAETPDQPIILRDLISESAVLEALQRAGPSVADEAEVELSRESRYQRADQLIQSRRLPSPPEPTL